MTHCISIDCNFPGPDLAEDDFKLSLKFKMAASLQNTYLIIFYSSSHLRAPVILASHCKSKTNNTLSIGKPNNNHHINKCFNKLTPLLLINFSCAKTLVAIFSQKGNVRILLNASDNLGFTKNSNTLNPDYRVLKDSKTNNYLTNKVNHPEQIDSFVLHLS